MSGCQTGRAHIRRLRTVVFVEQNATFCYNSKSIIIHDISRSDETKLGHSAAERTVRSDKQILPSCTACGTKKLC